MKVARAAKTNCSTHSSGAHYNSRARRPQSLNPISTQHFTLTTTRQTTTSKRTACLLNTRNNRANYKNNTYSSSLSKNYLALPRWPNPPQTKFSSLFYSTASQNNNNNDLKGGDANTNSTPNTSNRNENNTTSSGNNHNTNTNTTPTSSNVNIEHMNGSSNTTTPTNNKKNESINSDLNVSTQASSSTGSETTNTSSASSSCSTRKERWVSVGPSEELINMNSEEERKKAILRQYAQLLKAANKMKSDHRRLWILNKIKSEYKKSKDVSDINQRQLLNNVANAQVDNIKVQVEHLNNLGEKLQREYENTLKKQSARC